MSRVIGNTTATPNPRPDWEQTDQTKADFIKNKPKVFTEEEIIEIVDAHGGDEQIQADWDQTSESELDYIKNKPTLGELAEKNEISESDLESTLKEKINNKVDSDTVDNMIDAAFNEFITAASDDGTINTYKELIESAVAYAMEMNDLKLRTAELEKWRADEDYTPITVSLKVNSSSSITKEIGDTLTNASLTWSTSKEASAIRLELPNGTVISDDKGQFTDTNTYQAHTVGVDEVTYTYPCEKKWWIVVSEKNGKSDGTYATASSNVYLRFQHRIYWDIGTQASGFDSAFVTKLVNGKLSASKSTSFTVAPNTQYIYYAVPKDLCGTEPTFVIDKSGFAGGFAYKEIVTVTNSYGVPIDYYVYRSDQLLVGSTIVDVS